MNRQYCILHPWRDSNHNLLLRRDIYHHGFFRWTLSVQALVSAGLPPDLLLPDVLGVTRLIFVDALERACNRAYGSLPNMSWIFSRSDVPVYKSNWSNSYMTQLVEKNGRPGNSGFLWRVDQVSL